MIIIEFYLEDLKSKFAKINPKEYFLAYSGGKDSISCIGLLMNISKILMCEECMEGAE